MYQVKKDEFAKNGGNKATKSNSTPNLKDKKAEYKSKRVGKKVTNDFDDFDDDTPWGNDEAGLEDEF